MSVYNGCLNVDFLFGLFFFCLIVKQAQASVCDQKKKNCTCTVQMICTEAKTDVTPTVHTYPSAYVKKTEAYFWFNFKWYWIISRAFSHLQFLQLKLK